MRRIVEREKLCPGMVMIRVEAPEVAAKAEPGQFVIVRADEKGERIPISLADWDSKTIWLVFQEIGTSTRRLGTLEAGDSILNLVGPLGKPSSVDKFGTVVVASGCFGTGSGYALAMALKEAGNRVVYVVEGKNRDHLFWLDKIRAVSDRLVITCGDGTAEASCATDPLAETLRSEKVDRVYVMGCTFMMMECSRATEPYKTPTMVSLLPIMVDGTGMCGACRCTVDGKTKFGCIDGPEFDGHKVDWKGLIERSGAFLDEEIQSLDLWERENWHKVMRPRLV
jgi:ferredoxin/flavodoxin---NADP+ reductase